MRNFVVAGFGLGCPTSFSATLTARTCRRLGSAGEAQVGDVAVCQLCRAVGSCAHNSWLRPMAVVAGLRCPPVGGFLGAACHQIWSERDFLVLYFD